MIVDDLHEVQENVLNACKRANRNPDEVTLIAVSKTKPVSMLEEVYADGVRDFGENKVQELCDKYEVLPKDIRWHMIGHLQRNKVKYLIGKTCLIHSVDSVRLAETIEHEAAKKDTIMSILIEVNVAQEDSKFGLHVEEVMEMVETISKMPHIRIEGLMTIAPFVDDAEENRTIFRQLKQLNVDIGSKNMNNVNMNVLSMGMSGDYQVAIEEGATLVRVGTSIFGRRNYQV